MKSKGLVIVAALLAIVAAIGYYGAHSFTQPEPGRASAPEAAPAAPPSDLPPLDDSDDFVRARAAALSPAAAFQEWLKEDALIARLSAAMNMIANGKVPRDIFSVFAPSGKCRVVKKNGRITMDPSGFTRFDGFVAMVRAVDAVSTARLFEELLPLFDAAQRALGEKSTDARATFLAAVHELLDAPSGEDAAALVDGKKGLTWVYADEKLESLSPAQKQLLRMGPKNQAAVQAKLRAVALALGDARNP